MNQLRSFMMTVLGVTIAFAIFVFTASLGLALAGILGVVMIAGTIAAKLSPVRAPVHAKVRPGQRREPRIWNDGRGTIIDL